MTRVDRLLEGWVEASMGCRGEDAVQKLVWLSDGVSMAPLPALMVEAQGLA